MPLVSLVAVVPQQERALREAAPIAAYKYWKLAFRIPGAGTQIWLFSLNRYVTVRDIAAIDTRFSHKDKLVEIEFEVAGKELDWLIVGGWKTE